MSDSTFRFAFVTDPQIGMNSPSGLRGPGSDKERLDRAVAAINESNAEFVILGGDLIHNAKSEETDEQIDVLLESLAILNVPYHGVKGNHDAGDPAEEWKYDTHGLPQGFNFQHKHARFIGADSMSLRGAFGEDRRTEELASLTSALADVPADCDHLFVVMHWPLMVSHPGEENDYWNMESRDALIDLFAKHKVSCVLTGHWHQDIDARWRGVSLITSVGTSLPLQYPEERSFKLITVFPDGWSAKRVSVEQ